MNFSEKIFVAGHKGMVGSAIYRKLRKAGYNNIILASSSDLDLRNQAEVLNYFRVNRPDYVFLAAAKVGGIQANSMFRAEFIYDNLAIELNVIHSAYLSGVKKLLFLGSSCIYPRLAPQPIREEYLLEGALEPTNEGYAIAKIAGIKLCDTYRYQYGCNFISAMPTNLYGFGDNYNLSSSHVLPALIRKFHEAKVSSLDEVVVWGSGSPLREFMFAEDLADACLYLMLNHNDAGWINVGTGSEISIGQLAVVIKEIVGYNGNILFDTSKPDGTPRKLLDISKLNSLGYKHKTDLRSGIEIVYKDFVENIYPKL